MQLSTSPDDQLTSFLKINGDLRRQNNETIAELANKTAPEMLWHGPFKPLTNAAVEARFADNRTYVYQGKEVDRQVHLGFDLAVTARVPVTAAHAGRVLHAGDLGHLRQLRHPRPRPRRAVAVRAPVVDRRRRSATR